MSVPSSALRSNLKGSTPGKDLHISYGSMLDILTMKMWTGLL